MNDKSAAIEQLRINRSNENQDSGFPIMRIALVILILAVVLITAWWFFANKTESLVVQVATATSAQNETATAASLDATGYVVANRQATVAAKIIGKLSHVYFEEGQHVKAGQILATLDSTNVAATLNQAKAQVELARSTLKGKESVLEISQRLLQRQQKLQASGWVSRDAVDNLAATIESQRNDVQIAKGQLAVQEATMQVVQRNMDDTTVRAPFDGVVTVKAAQPGEIISPSSGGGGFTRTGICTIVAMDSLEVNVDVNENFINRIRAGQAAIITLNAYKDWQIPAEVIAVVPTADRAKATVGVRLAFKQRDARILPQMGVNVRFLSNAEPASNVPVQDKGVVIPSSAVKAEGESSVVFVVNNNTVERRVVTLGATSGSSQKVLSGLRSGEKVAIGDISKLANGVTVQIK
jgi:RND family efflux transporter MFP subunit